MNSKPPLNLIVKGTIKSTGKASRLVQPDRIQLDAYLRTEAVSPKESLALLMQESKQLQQAFRAAGFQDPELRTGRVSVNELTKEVEKGRWVVIGYSTKIRLSVITEFRSGILAELLQAAAKSECEAELKVGYFLDDPDAVKNDLLEEATQDALKRAKIIAAATGQTIGSLVRAMDQESAFSRGSSRPFTLNALRGDDIAELGDFIEENPDDIELSTSVICSFELLAEG